MQPYMYDPDEIQKIKFIRKNSYIRISAYFFLFIAGVLAGMAIAGLLS